MDSHFPSTRDGLFHVNLGKLELCCRISIWFWIRGWGDKKNSHEIWNGEWNNSNFHTLEVGRAHPTPRQFIHNVTGCHSPCWGGTATRPTAFSSILFWILWILNQVSVQPHAKGTNFSCRSLTPVRLGAARDTHGFLFFLMDSSLPFFCQLHIQFSFQTAGLIGSGPTWSKVFSTSA